MSVRLILSFMIYLLFTGLTATVEKQGNETRSIRIRSGCSVFDLAMPSSPLCAVRHSQIVDQPAAATSEYS
jgi:hypothetical protein